MGGLIDTPRLPVRSGFVVFVLKAPGRSGATKVQIAGRRGGRDVVLEHVGTATRTRSWRSWWRWPARGSTPVRASLRWRASAARRRGPGRCGGHHQQVERGAMTRRSLNSCWLGSWSRPARPIRRAGSTTSVFRTLRSARFVAHASSRTMFRSLRRAPRAVTTRPRSPRRVLLTPSWPAT